MAGRRPKPTALKRAQGNPGKGKLRDDEPTATTGTTAPRWLSKGARAEWTRTTKAAKELGTLTKLDRSVHAVHCQAVDDFAKAAILIQDHGHVILGCMGTMVKNPAVDVANQAASIIRQTAIELGFTPAARSRIPSNKKPQKTDFEKFKSKGGMKAIK